MLGFAFNPQLLAPQRAQVRLKLRVRRLRGCRRGAGEDRVQAWLPGPPAGHGLRSRRPLRPFRCERGIRGGSGRSRRTLAQDLDLWLIGPRPVGPRRPRGSAGRRGASVLQTLCSWARLKGEKTSFAQRQMDLN